MTNAVFVTASVLPLWRKQRKAQVSCTRTPYCMESLQPTKLLHKQIRNNQGTNKRKKAKSELISEL